MFARAHIDRLVFNKTANQSGPVTSGRDPWLQPIRSKLHKTLDTYLGIGFHGYLQMLGA